METLLVGAVDGLSVHLRMVIWIVWGMVYVSPSFLYLDALRACPTINVYALCPNWTNSPISRRNSP